MWPAVQLALEDVNNSTDVLPNTRLEIVFHDSRCNVEAGLDGLIEVHNAYKSKRRGTADPPLVYCWFALNV